MMNEKTKITFQVDDNTMSFETPHNDLSFSEILDAFIGLCVGHTWSTGTIYNAMKEYLDERL